MSEKPIFLFFSDYCSKHGLPDAEFRVRFPFLFRNETEPLLRELYSEILAEPKDTLPDGLFYYHKTLHPRSFFDSVKAFAQKHGSDPISLYLPLYILLAHYTAKQHAAIDVPPSVSSDTLAEIALWGKKHYALCGEWGLSDYYWCTKYLGGELFRVGSLDYQLCESPSEDIPNGGEPILKIHIPSGCDFSHDMRQKSYRDALWFYAPRLHVRKMTFVCESWLLARDHAALEGSNISDFRNDFTIVKEYSDYETGFLWRIFGSEDIQKPEMLSQNNRLKALYREKLIRHEPFYSALGYFTLSL